jgi:hypothetical protein
MRQLYIMQKVFSLSGKFHGEGSRGEGSILCGGKLYEGSGDFLHIE